MKKFIIGGAAAVVLVGAGIAGKMYLDGRAKKATDHKAAEAAKRAAVIELMPADINGDEALDVIAIYKYKVVKGGTVSLMEAYDGATGATLWTSQIDGEYNGADRGERVRSFVVGKKHFAISADYLSSPGGESEHSVIGYSLSTGEKLWHRATGFVLPRAGFRIWRDDQQLLVRISSSTGIQELQSLDIATGTPAWTAVLGRFHASYNDEVVLDFVGSDIAVTPQGSYEKPKMLLIDKLSGSIREMPVSELRRNRPMVTGDQLLITCERREDELVFESSVSTCIKTDAYRNALADQCEGAGDADCVANADAAFDRLGWLARLDSKSGVLEPVMTDDGSLAPLPDTEDGWLLRVLYNRDLVLQFSDEVQAYDIHTGSQRWLLTQPNDSVSWNKHLVSSRDATRLRTIPTRYIPLSGENDGGKLAILDVESGKLVWESKLFSTEDSVVSAFPFTYHGGNYYFEMHTEFGVVLVSIDGNRGHVSSVDQIQFEDHTASPIGWQQYKPSPWQFRRNRLVGSQGRQHLWSIDLDSHELVMSRPEGVRLTHPWDAVEALLGPLPRAMP